MNKTHLKAYVSAINGALVSRRAALQCELAVAFAVLLETNVNKRLARETMIDIYSNVGYDCKTPSSRDWLSINRRVRAAFALFDKCGYAEVSEWAGSLTRSPLLDAIAAKLAPLKLATVNEVLTLCEKVKPQRPRNHAREEQPDDVVVEFPHLRFVIPRDVTRNELMEAVAKLMAIASSMPSTPFELPSVARPAKGVETDERQAA